MPYCIGDILLKIDHRASAGTKHSRHHVMLVVGESQAGYPIVMHMLGAPHFKLVKEELTRGHDLEKIHYPCSNETRELIAQIAESALKSNQFIINEKVLEEQCNAVTNYRPKAHFEEASKLAQLRKKFLTDCDKDLFTPTPKAVTTISCHEWVMKIIHYAFRQTKTEIPLGLQVPPDLAWADRLFCSAKSVPKMVYTTLTPTAPPSGSIKNSTSVTKPVIISGAESAATVNTSDLIAVPIATLVGSEKTKYCSTKACVTITSTSCSFFQPSLKPEPDKNEALTQQKSSSLV